MARYRGAACRLCRREGEKLFLKGERCFTSKCAVERREGVPGQHGRGRQSFSDYKVQLREKQKVKRTYGMMESEFRGQFERAERSKGVTGTQLLLNLETRLDNIVYRLGFAYSRRQARQLVSHGHVFVNNKRVDIPSYSVAQGDEIQVREKSRANVVIQGSMASALGRLIPEWLSLDKDQVKGKVTALPSRQQMASNIREQLIVELYSR